MFLSNSLASKKDEEQFFIKDKRQRNMKNSSSQRETREFLTLIQKQMPVTDWDIAPEEGRTGSNYICSEEVELDKFQYNLPEFGTPHEVNGAEIESH